MDEARYLKDAPKVMVDRDVAVLRCLACDQERPVAEFRYCSSSPYYGYWYCNAGFKSDGAPIWHGWQRNCMPCQKAKAAATRARNKKVKDLNHARWSPRTELDWAAVNLAEALRLLAAAERVVAFFHDPIARS